MKNTSNQTNRQDIIEQVVRAEAARLMARGRINVCDVADLNGIALLEAHTDTLWLDDEATAVLSGIRRTLETHALVRTSFEVDGAPVQLSDYVHEVDGAFLVARLVDGQLRGPLDWRTGLPRRAVSYRRREDAERRALWQFGIVAV
jgi:hypothetical protein